MMDDAAAVPVGSRLLGTVLESRGVGLGLKRERARLELSFDHLLLPNGEQLAIGAELTGFDNARETVDRGGRIRGIRSTNALGERMNVRLGGVRLTPFRAVYRSSLVAFPLEAIGIWAANTIIFGMTDPEIDYPVGSEFELRLTTPWLHEARFPAYRGEKPETAFDQAALQDFLDQQPALSYFEKGEEADPVNLLLVGDAAKGLAAAGWNGADEKRPRNCFRALRAVATARAYHTGPMTPLLLDQRRPDGEWQKSFNTYAKRHHLRMWRAQAPWPNGDAWLVAATHDTGLAVEGRRLTHQVDRYIDRERERIVADLMLTGCVDAVTYVHRPSGATRPWITDGKVAVVQLNACTTRAASQAASPSRLVPSTPRSFPWRLAQRFTLNARNTLLRENNAYRGYDFARHLMLWRKHNQSTANRPE
jgi:hypothetical protein